MPSIFISIHLVVTSSQILFVRPNTFEQLEVSKELFGKAAAYLKGPNNINWKPEDMLIVVNTRF